MRWSLLVVLLFAGLLIAPPPSPIHLSYATSDSMEPTISPGDAYIVVGWEDVEFGDIVTFHSDAREGFVTHRVVGRTDGGFVTQGDANPSTDQASGLSPVEESDILGTVLTVGGTPVVIPKLGVAIESLSSNAPLWAGVAVLLALLALGRGSRRATQRRVPSMDDIVKPVFAIGIVGSLGVLLLLGGGVYSFQYTAVEGQPTAPSQVTAGEPTPRTYEMQLSKPPLTTVIVDTDGMTVRNQTIENGTILLNATVQPPAEPGAFGTTVRTYPYPSTLPKSMLASLHAVHPLLAASVSSGIVFGPLYVLYVVLFNGRVMVRPPRNRRARRYLGGDR